MNVIAGLILLALINCFASEPKQEEMPTSFDFVFSYGVMNKNVLDTVQGTYTKDLVTAGIASTKLNLTDEEKNQVYELMNEIGVWNYPSEIEGMYIEPASGYHLQIFVDGKEQTIRWIGEFHGSKAHMDFKRLTDMIIQIIRDKEAYQEMPDSGGYYE